MISLKKSILAIGVSTLLAASAFASTAPLQGTLCDFGHRCTLTNGMAYYPLNVERDAQIICSIHSHHYKDIIISTNNHAVISPETSVLNAEYRLGHGNKEFTFTVKYPGEKKINGVGNFRVWTDQITVSYKDYVVCNIKNVKQSFSNIDY